MQIVFFLHKFSFVNVDIMTFTETVTVQNEAPLKLYSYVQ